MVSILKTDKIQASHGTNIEIPSGHVLQAPGHVIQFATSISNGTYIATTSASLVASGTTVSITPKFSNSIIVLYYSASFTSLDNVAAGGTAMKFYKSIAGGSYGVVTGMASSSQAGFLEYNSNASSYNHSVGTMMVTDSPSTTSAVTYQLYIQRVGSSHSAAIQRDWGGTHFHAMEIAQ
tara:strand:+ start:522 stop:1058 length:537 start_codon:yes stop_codon:yes gene_type:complete